MNVNITDPIFHDEAKAERHIFLSRWPDEEPVCPHCGCTNTMQMGGKTQAGMWLCRDCRDKFTVRTGTVMERSHIPLTKWLLATHLLAASKKGMSALQLSRMLGITYKSAWFLSHRIREAMAEANSPTTPLGGEGKVVESDEAFVGGFKKKRLSGKVAPKKKVMTLVERDGRARSFHVTNIDHTNIRSALVTNVHRSSTLMTDDARWYVNVGREFAKHGSTLHSNREFSRGDGHHSNTAENFFSILKRGVIGTYHHWSETHILSTSDAEMTEHEIDELGHKCVFLAAVLSRFAAHIQDMSEPTLHERFQQPLAYPPEPDDLLFPHYISS